MNWQRHGSPIPSIYVADGFFNPTASEYRTIEIVKKSQAVPATLCAAAAVLILQGCSTRSTIRRCVDPSTGTLLPDTACSNPTAVSTYRGGRYARVNSEKGTICLDTVTNLSVSMSNCRGSSMMPGAFFAAGRLLRPSWGYDGQVDSRTGRVTNFKSQPPANADIKSSTGRIISRSGLGSTGRSSSGGFFG